MGKYVYEITITTPNVIMSTFKYSYKNCIKYVEEQLYKLEFGETLNITKEEIGNDETN